MTVGSQVAGQVWRGRVVQVTAGGVTQQTAQDPTGEPLELGLGGAGFAAGGVLGIVTGAVWLASPSVPSAPRRGAAPGRRSGRGEKGRKGN